MAVNVLLPFCSAWGSATGDRQLPRVALALYRRWPALPENEITREVRARLYGPGPVRESPQRTMSARRQQGMIHLYRRWTSLRV